MLVQDLVSVVLRALHLPTVQSRHIRQKKHTLVDINLLDHGKEI
jgi:hypothetical protein